MMNSAILLSSLWLLAAPPGDTSLAPVPGDYELWRVDRHNQASGLDTLSKCVLSRFDLANPTKPEQIPVDAPTSFSLSAGAQWAGLSGLLANNSSKIDDYLPKKPLLANNFVRGVLSVSHDEKMVLTFGLENDKPMPNYIEYQIVETKTKKKIFNGRFRGHCMRGEASGLLTEGDTLAYFVKRSRSPSAKSHGHLIAISRQGNESRIPHIDAWQVFSSPTGSAVLIADFYFDDEGKKCDSLLSLYDADCKAKKWNKTVSHTGWSADSVVMGLQCFWSTDARLLTIIVLRDNATWLMFLDAKNGEICGEMPTPFNWIMPHGVLVCPKKDKKDVMRLFELEQRQAATCNPGYLLNSQATTRPASQFNEEDLIREVGKRNP